MALAIEVVFKYMGLNPVLVWEKLVESHPKIVPEDKTGMLYDKRVRFSEVMPTIKHRNKQHFNIVFEEAVLDYSSVMNHDLSFLLLEKCVVDADDASIWAQIQNGSVFHC